MKQSIAFLALIAALGIPAARQEAQEKSKAADAAKTLPMVPPIRFNPNASAVLVASDTLSVAVSADGKRIASVGGSYNPTAGFASVLDVASKKELVSLRFSKAFNSVDISPDGKSFAFTGRSGDLKLVDVETGKTVFSKTLNSPAQVAFAPDGQSIATVTESKSAQLWDVPSGEELGKFVGATMPLRCVAFSTDGKRLAAGSGAQQKKGESNGTIFIWNTVTRTMVHRLESENLAPITAIAFAPDGKHIAGSSSVRQVRVWELPGSKLTLTTDVQPQVFGLSFSQDGNTLAAAGGDGSIQLLDPTSGDISSISGNAGVCRCVAFLDRGKKLVSGGGARSLRLWDVAQKKELAVLREDERLDSIPVPSAMAATSDGSLIALATEDKGVFLRDGRNGELKGTLKGHEDVITCITFSPDNKTLATGSADKTIKLWDAPSGKLKSTITGHTNWIYSLAFSHDGKTLASGAYDKTIRFWDVESDGAKGVAKGVIEAHRGAVRAVAFSPDDALLASGGSDRFVKVWTVASRELKFATKGHEATVRVLAFSADGKTLASGGEEGVVKLWDPNTGMELIATRKPHTGDVTAIAFVGSRTLLSGGVDNSIRHWDVATGELLNVIQGHSGGVTGIAVMSDGMHFLSTGADRAIKRFRRELTPTQLFAGHTGVVQYTAFSHDGKRFVSCGEWPEGDETVRVWDVQKGTEILKIEHPGQAAMAVFSPDGKFIASASNDSHAYLWDAETGAKIQTFTGHAKAVVGVAFDAKGTQLLTGSDDSTSRVWDIKSGGEIQKFTGHAGGTVRRVAFHPDGKRALSAGRDNYVRMWDLETGKQVKKYISSGKWADSLAVTRDGKYLAIAGTSGAGREVYVYDIASGDRLVECAGHGEGLTHVSFSPDGKRILSSSYDGTARLWSRETGKELYRFRYGEFLWCAEFSPDGQSFLTGGGGGFSDGKFLKGTDHTVRLWKVPDEKAIEEFATENY